MSDHQQHHHHHDHEHARHGGLTLAERHAHEAETYDEMSVEILATWDEMAYLVDPSTIPVPNREQVDYLGDAVRRLGPLAGRRLLEVGAGGGSLAVWLAQQGAEVVGIDVSPGILEVARKRAELNGVADRTSFVHAPVETFDPVGAGLGFAHFDAIIGNNVVHHFDRDLALANLGRLLAPGAVAVFCEPVLFLPEIARTVRNSRLVSPALPSAHPLPRRAVAQPGRLRDHAALVPARGVDAAPAVRPAAELRRALRPDVEPTRRS